MYGTLEITRPSCFSHQCRLHKYGAFKVMKGQGEAIRNLEYNKGAI